MRDGSMDMGYGYDIDMATLRFFQNTLVLKFHGHGQYMFIKT